MGDGEPDGFPVRSDLPAFAAIPRWVEDAVNGSPQADRAYRLYGMLTGYAFRGWRPTRRELGDRLNGITPRTVDRATDLLVDIGAISKRPVRNSSGRQVATEYVVHAHPYGEPPDDGGGGTTPATGEGDTSVAPEGDTSVAPTRDKRKQETLLQEPTDRPDGDDRPRRRSQVPDDYTPDDSIRRWAAHETPDVNVDRERDKFVDHHRSKGNRFKSHDRAFRNWLRKAQEFAERDGRVRDPGRRFEDADPDDGGYWQPEGARSLVDEEDDDG